MVLRTSSEEREQMNVIQWAEWNMQRYPALRWLFHTPNGGSRNKIEAVKLKAMGTKSGVADLCLPCPRGAYCGLFIEMKATGGRLMDTQKIFLEDMAAVGHYVATCYSAEIAICILKEYLNLTGTAEMLEDNNSVLKTVEDLKEREPDNRI